MLKPVLSFTNTPPHTYIYILYMPKIYFFYLREKTNNKTTPATYKVPKYSAQTKVAALVNRDRLVCGEIEETCTNLVTSDLLKDRQGTAEKHEKWFQFRARAR